MAGLLDFFWLRKKNNPSFDSLFEQRIRKILIKERKSVSTGTAARRGRRYEKGYSKDSKLICNFRTDSSPRGPECLVNPFFKNSGVFKDGVGERIRGKKQPKENTRLACFTIEETEFRDVMIALGKLKFKFALISEPLQLKAYHLVDIRDEYARLSCSVDAISVENGKTIGHSLSTTAAYSLLRKVFREAGPALRKRNLEIAILGSSSLASAALAGLVLLLREEDYPSVADGGEGKDSATKAVKTIKKEKREATTKESQEHNIRCLFPDAQDIKITIISGFEERASELKKLYKNFFSIKTLHTDAFKEGLESADVLLNTSYSSLGVITKDDFPVVRWLPHGALAVEFSLGNDDDPWPPAPLSENNNIRYFDWSYFASAYLSMLYAGITGDMQNPSSVRQIILTVQPEKGVVY
ncbi:MAG: hypothetical protein QW728_04590 [Thermoplasmata archaeon]